MARHLGVTKLFLSEQSSCFQSLREKVKLEWLPCEQILSKIEISRALLPPISHGEKGGKFQNVVKIAHKAVIHILLSL